MAQANTIQARRCYSTVFQSMSTERLYSDLSGAEMRTSGAGQSPPEGFHVLSWKPWLLQVQEEGDDGVWRMISNESFMRKDQALSDAARQGIELDYVSHHADHVRSTVIGSR